ncbi:MAG: hypothetical protein O3C60_19115 [Planctomycetota bacterium]|nr:hypothetical protein [Planctomycetota bacterium]
MQSYLHQAALTVILIGMFGSRAPAQSGVMRRPFHHGQRIYTYAAPNRVYRNKNNYSSNYNYPHYVGGFHARYFENEGLPRGDIGLRGNGSMAFPW